MRFDEAFDILVEHCARFAVSPGHAANASRTSTYGNDIWITAVVRSYYTSRVDPNTLKEEHYLPFYDAGWELCRIGVLRPRLHAPMGQGAIGGGIFSGDGFSITGFGLDWLTNPQRRAAGDPSRLSEIFASFEKLYGPGFAQRATEAICCHRTGNYLAACVMAGAAAESILLAVAIGKMADEPKVLKEYASAGGRGRLPNRS
jgi:hypothetical protein